MSRPTRAENTARQLEEIRGFLRCETPQGWLDRALLEQDLLLIDHANCEKKAANTALNLMFRHVGDYAFLHGLSQLAREELRHFEQVIAVMEARGIEYSVIDASRYAAGMLAHVCRAGSQRLVDTLIVGAYIEARSCERFAALAPRLDPELGAFYGSLLRSEARHYRNYLGFARKVAGARSIDERVHEFGLIEADLISSPDPHFRFHSGDPVAVSAQQPGRRSGSLD